MLRNTMKLSLAGVAGAVILSAAPASAQVTGTVNVTGFVAASCAVATTVNGTIPLGNLALPAGTVNTALTGAANFRVNCTGTSPKVTLSATSMLTNSPAPAGFTNTVRYDAHMSVDLAAGGSPSFVFHTATATGDATTPQTLAGMIAAPTSDNIHISVDTLSTATPTDTLVSGNYGAGLAGGSGGVITFTISNS